MDTNDLMTLDEAVEYSKLSKWTFSELIRKGKMPFYKINSRIRLFSKSDIDTYLADCHVRVKVNKEE